VVKNKFKHIENGKTYEVEKVFNEYGIDIVIYKEYTLTPTTYYKRYCRDLYMFLSRMELIKEEEK